MQRGFLIIVAGFAGGVAFRSFFDFGVSFAFFLLLLGVLLCALFLIKRSAPFLFAGLFVIAMVVGILRFDYSENPARTHALDAYLGKTVILEGSVADEPDVRTDHTKLVIETEHSILGDEVSSAGTKILVIAERYPEFSYGDTVRVRGIPQKPPRAIEDDTSGGRPFDYAAYLAKDGVYYEMFYPHLARLSSNNGNPIKHALFYLKRAYLQKLSEALPEPHSALAGGITVGAKEALGGDLLEMFRTAGVIHIVVLSGYNITIIARLVGRAVSFAPRSLGIGISAGSVILFALMTGAGATVMRASVMALLALLARATGRVGEMTIILVVAAFLMIFHNPHILVFDPSFQLSFLATLGLLFFAPRAERFFAWLPAAWGIREAAGATLATQIFVLPALIYMMGEFSTVSFLTNILILPLMPLAMLFSFLASLTAFLPPLAGIPFSYTAWALLEYQLKVATFFASLPSASIAVSGSALLIVAALYAVAALSFARQRPIVKESI